jgi:hypothetical protein
MAHALTVTPAAHDRFLPHGFLLIIHSWLDLWKGEGQGPPQNRIRIHIFIASLKSRKVYWYFEVL